MPNPLVHQGTLNRVRTAVYPANFPGLAITTPYMSRSLARLSPEGAAVNQIATGSGVVNAPEPYQFFTLTIGLLRTQALANAWLTQYKDNGYIGDVSTHGDSAAFDVITLNEVSIQSIDPGAYDGTDPTVQLVLRGILQINNSLWDAI